MDRSLGFRVYSIRLDALFRLAFASASLYSLTLPDIVTRRLIMQKARDRTRLRIVLSRLVDTRFQVLFTPLAGVLFAFPSRYWCTIGRQVVFSLGRWSSRIPTELLELRGTQVPSRALQDVVYAAVTLSGGLFQALRLSIQVTLSTALQPHRWLDQWFGLLRFRSPLLAESLI